MKNRIRKIQKELHEKDLDGFIVTNPFNIFYLSTFRGVSPFEREAILVVTPGQSTLITARLYQQEAKKVVSSVLKIKIANERNEINQFVKEAISKVSPTDLSAEAHWAKTKAMAKVGFEQHDITFSEFKQFKKLLKDKKLVPTKHLVEDLRLIKSPDEIKKIEKAQTITQSAFDEIIKTIKAGQTEEQISETLVKIIKSLGGQGLAFDPIIASGPNSAKPHHVTGDRRLSKNDVLLFDFGAKYKDYCADLSRTIFVGRVPDAKKNIYHHVQTSQNMAIAKIGTGVAAKRAHSYANSHFKKHKLNQFFLHSLGHGVGLEVHEKPSLSKKSKDTLREGMVFSVEPGLYFPAWGGVRIEDLVVIISGEAQILGKKSQFLQIPQ